MKIRTGFVTNSSSYSSAVITIQSKKFVTLLKEYEDVVGPDRLGGINGIIKGYTFSVICDDEQAPEWCETRKSIFQDVTNSRRIKQTIEHNLRKRTFRI